MTVAGVPPVEVNLLGQYAAGSDHPGGTISSTLPEIGLPEPPLACPRLLGLGRDELIFAPVATPEAIA